MKDKHKLALNTTELILIIVVSMILGTGITMIVTKDSQVLTKVDNNLATIIDTYNNIKDNYYTDVSDDDLVNGAVKGMLEAVGDPYTTYMGESYDNFNITLEGSYEGIGVEISKVKDEIVIVGIFASSPASEAGLKLGDIIVSVDDKVAKDMDTKEFSNYVRTNTKETIDLVVKRDDKEQKYTIKRRKVEIKSIASEVFEKDNKKVGYIYMSIFASNTYEQFKNALSSLEAQNIDSLIIDLRSNTGGELTAATNIISLFLNNDKIMYQTESKDGKIEKTYSFGNKDKKYPIVVLVNENSASASEVMTAALKENLGATVIGKKTFGKGTVQTVLRIATGEQYKMTTKKWLTPNGNWINGKGIAPDIEVDNTNEDLQLERAKQYLLER